MREAEQSPVTSHVHEVSFCCDNTRDITFPCDVRSRRSDLACASIHLGFFINDLSVISPRLVLSRCVSRFALYRALLRSVPFCCCIPFYYILSYSILFYPIPFHFILFYSILFYSSLFYSILFYSVLFYSILFCSVLFFFVLFFSFFLFSVLFCSVLFFFFVLLFSILFCSCPFVLLHSAPFCTVLLRSALFRSVLLRSASFCSVLFRSAPIYSILFCSVLSHSVPFCSVPFHFVDFVLFVISSHFIWFHRTLFRLVSSGPVGAFHLPMLATMK